MRFNVCVFQTNLDGTDQGRSKIQGRAISCIFSDLD